MSYYSCLGCSKGLSQWPRAVTSTILSYIAKVRIRAAPRIATASSMNAAGRSLPQAAATRARPAAPT